MSMTDMQMYDREQIRRRLMRDGLEALLEIPENQIAGSIRPVVSQVRRSLRELFHTVGLQDFFQT